MYTIPYDGKINRGKWEENNVGRELPKRPGTNQARCEAALAKLSLHM